MTSNKLGGFDFWRNTLGSPRLILAPMVDASELPWRILSRRYGAELCYSPMLHASVFLKDTNYRTEALTTTEKDRPLIVQFCANDSDILLQAAKMAQPFCDAIDLNLGCPQMIAKRGHYGAFLQEEWDLLKTMVSKCHRELDVPITCKIRIFESVEKTVKYAQMLENAGCQLLTVHGRTKEQKGVLTGLASWKHIKAVKESVSIPVFANGNIQYLSDMHNCLKETGVEGVMSAEGNLHNPAIFIGKAPTIFDISKEYLSLAREYPCPLSAVRGHLFKICHHAMCIHTEVRQLLATGKSLEDFETVVELIKQKCQADEELYVKNPEQFSNDLPFPYWVCQPYVRGNSISTIGNSEKSQKKSALLKDRNDNMSINRLKKLKRNPKKNFQSKEWQICEKCGNPKGLKCTFGYCRVCCKIKARLETRDCPGHNLKFYTRSLHRSNSEAAEKLQTLTNEQNSNAHTQASTSVALNPNCFYDNQILENNLNKSKEKPEEKNSIDIGIT